LSVRARSSRYAASSEGEHEETHGRRSVLSRTARPCDSDCEVEVRWSSATQIHSPWDEDLSEVFIPYVQVAGDVTTLIRAPTLANRSMIGFQCGAARSYRRM